MNIVKDMDVGIYKAACASSEFMKKHDPTVESWEDPVGWCAWYISNGFMVALHREDGSIQALACGRPVNDPRDGNIPFKYAENGPCIYIDFLAIEEPHPLVLPAFTIELRQRFGQRKKVAYRRVSAHDYDNFLRNMSRITRTGQPNEPTTTTITS